MSVLNLLPLLLAASPDSSARVPLAEVPTASVAAAAAPSPATVAPEPERARRVRVGLVNVDDDSVDLQVGLVNLARSGAGTQVGLWNRSRRGGAPGTGGEGHCGPSDWRFQGDAWGTESGLSNLGVAVGWRSLQLVAGASLSAARGTPAAGGYFGIGAQWRGERSWLGLDLVSTRLLSDSAWREMRDRRDSAVSGRHSHRGEEGYGNGLATLRLSAGRKVWKRLEVYGGVTGNVLSSHEAEGERKYLAPPGAYHWDATSQLRFWPGAFVGIRI